MIKEITVQQLKQLMDENAKIFILDVRDPSEYEVCNIGGTLIPLNELPHRLEELDAKAQIIVHCKMGGRSMRAVEFLEGQGFSNVYNLKGGIAAWAKEIDPEMAMY